MINIKALVITASTRKQSNSVAATKLFIRTLKNKNTALTVKTIDINPLKIKPCTACLKCRESYACVIKDDVSKILKHLATATVVIIASPVYFMGAPAKLKALIDRSEPAWFKYSKGTKKKWKNGAIILTAEANDKSTFVGATNEIKSFLAVNGIKTKTTVTLGAMQAENIFTRDKKAQRKIIKAAMEFAND